MICVLEDDAERVRQFLAVAAIVAPGMAVRVWRDAHAMIAEMAECLEQAAVISLDHDLHRLPGSEDPGSGYDVATLLGELVPCCAIIVHTSNGERGDWMVAELERAGWRWERVYRDGDDWIAKGWGPALGRGLAKGVKTGGRLSTECSDTIYKRSLIASLLPPFRGPRDFENL